MPSAPAKQKREPITDTGAVQSTEVRLILAAERLFGARGIEAVSLREIAQQAGQGNNAAVHYHFGGRDELVTEISRYRVAQLDIVRRRMLDKMHRMRRQDDLRALVETLFLPQLTLVDEDGQHPYAQFMTQYLIWHSPTGMPHAGRDRTPQTSALHELIDLFHARLPELSRRQLSRRLELVNLMFSNLLARYDVAHDVGGAMLKSAVEDAIEMALASLEAPVQTSRSTPAFRAIMRRVRLMRDGTS